MKIPSRLILGLALLACASPTLAACPSDCDGNGTVGMAEISAAVEILLGREAATTCSAADRNADGRVTAREVVRGVLSLVDGCPPENARISGVVRDVDDGGALPFVAVSFGTRSASTDSHGVFAFEGLEAGPVMVSFRLDAYATTHEIVTAAAIDAPVSISMKKASLTETFDAARGGSFVTDGSVVRIASDTLRQPDGDAPNGDVQIVITKFDAASGDIGAFPGRFEGTTSGGSTTDIESFGFATYELRDGDGPVNLAPGSTAEIEFLLADSDQGKFGSGETIGLWALDESTGTWEEENAPGSVGPSSQQNGKLAWIAQVPHFSTWNADRPVTEKHCLRGTVLFDGAPVAGAQVSAAGVSYNGTTETSTAADGTFCVDVMRGSNVRIEVRLNGSALALSSRLVTVSSAEASCAAGTCTTLAPFVLSMIACVSGLVTDAEGLPLAGETVHVLPGRTVVTGADGRYCSPAPVEAQVTVIAYGHVSETVSTTGGGDCPDGTCAEANLATVTSGNAFTFTEASVFFSRTMSPDFSTQPPTYVPSDFISAYADFLVLAEGGGGGSQTVTTEEIGGCTVTTFETTFTQDPDAPPPSFLPLDPGNPGSLTNGAAPVAMVRQDPASQNPPDPSLLGSFAPQDGADLQALGYAPGQQMTFEWPGGADIGPFSGTLGLPPAVDVLTPDLADPNLDLVAGDPFQTAWTPSGFAGEMLGIQLSATRYTEDPKSGDTIVRTVIVHCEYPDSAGQATIPGEATAGLPDPKDSAAITYVRKRILEVPAELRRSGEQGSVSIKTSSTLQRPLYDFGGP